MTAAARLNGVSMYSQLLAASFAVVGADLSTRDDLLLERLRGCRERLSYQHGHGRDARGPATGDAPGEIARQIDYDVVLMCLCRRHGIDCDPDLFNRPLAERRRLEEALRVAGVQIDGGSGAVS